MSVLMKSIQQEADFTQILDSFACCHCDLPVCTKHRLHLSSCHSKSNNNIRCFSNNSQMKVINNHLLHVEQPICVCSVTGGLPTWFLSKPHWRGNINKCHQTSPSRFMSLDLSVALGMIWPNQEAPETSARIERSDFWKALPRRYYILSFWAHVALHNKIKCWKIDAKTSISLSLVHLLAKKSFLQFIWNP